MATIDRVDDGASPRQVIDAVIIRLATLFENDREAHRVRTTVIESEPALLERELLKQEQWARTIAAMLAKRGLNQHRAVVLATAATSTFRSEYQAWAGDRSRTGLTSRIRVALDSLALDLT